MKKFLSALVFVSCIGTSNAEPITVIAGCMVIGAGVFKIGEAAVSWYRGDAEKEKAKDKALQTAEKELDRYMKELAIKQQEIAAITKRLELEITNNTSVAAEKQQAEERIDLLREEIEIREQELSLAYVKCIEKFSKEECESIADLIRLKSARLNLNN